MSEFPKTICRYCFEENLADNHAETCTEIFKPKKFVSSDELAHKKAKEIIEKREEVLEAFVAKYGYQPDEMVICEQPSQGLWWVDKRSKWIPVKSKLPEDKQIVLVINEHHEMAVCECKIYEDNWQYIFMLYQTSHQITKVTHWMELPEPPT